MKVFSLSHIQCCSLFTVQTVAVAVAAPTYCGSRNGSNCNYIVLSVTRIFHDLRQSCRFVQQHNSKWFFSQGLNVEDRTNICPYLGFVHSILICGNKMPTRCNRGFYWSPRSAQYVSSNLLPIFRSVRLRFLQHMV